MRTLSRWTATLLIITSWPLAAQQIVVSKENKTIAITTNSDADALADTAVITVGFQLFGKDEDGTYTNATETSNAVFLALTGAGVQKDAIQSRGQSLNPINAENDKTRYAEGMRFTYSQSWLVTVPAEQAAAILNVAITSGANESGDIQWSLKNDDGLAAEAARKALEHARQLADRMAQGLNAKLGALLYASNEQPPGGISRYGIAGGSGGGVLFSSKQRRILLAIAPERITRSATVYAVFAIE